MVKQQRIPAILQPDYQNHWIENQTNEEYHGSRDSLSSSSLKYMERSARHFRAFHIEGIKKEPTDAMEFGTMVHSIVLEPQTFLDRYIITPDFNLATKLGKAQHEAWQHENRNKNMVQQGRMDSLLAMVDSLTSNPMVVKLLKGSANEVSGYYRDPVTGLKCRIRPDSMNKNFRVLTDVKKARDASPEGFFRAIDEYRYDLQIAFYWNGIKEITGVGPDISCFLAVEEEYPHACAIHEVPEALLATGSHQYRFFLDRIADCIARNRWPSYNDDRPKPIEVPPWFQTKVQNRIEQLGG